MANEMDKELIKIREFDMEKDFKAVEELEKRCKVGPATAIAGKENKNNSSMSLLVDLMGDPLGRIRHAKHHLMLVAEYRDDEIIGVIRSCIKMVTRGRATTKSGQDYVKVAYILGLRVSPTHRRLGVGTRLVHQVHSWCSSLGSIYSYVAIDAKNRASINLFTNTLKYTIFRSPILLAHPIHSHNLHVSSSTTILRIPPHLAAKLYAKILAPSTTEFIPSDLSSLLAHPLTIATFMAAPSSHANPALWVSQFPPSFAVLSLWDSTKTLRLRVEGGNAFTRAVLGILRLVDERLPWMQVPSLRDVFRPFGVYVMYGLCMRGEDGGKMMRELCRVAHNVAVGDERCAAVVAEVGRGDVVAKEVMHWRRFCWEDDVWCMKRVSESGNGDDDDDWLTTRPSTESLFVDPREF